MMSGSPVPQKVVVDGAVNVLDAMTAVTVTLCVLVNVVVQLTGEILRALTVKLAFDVKAPDVRIRLALAPSAELPVVDAPL